MPLSKADKIEIKGWIKDICNRLINDAMDAHESQFIHKKMNPEVVVPTPITPKPPAVVVDPMPTGYYPFVVNPPRSPVTVPIINSKGFFDIGNESDGRIENRSITGTEYGLHVGSNQTSRRWEIVNFEAKDCFRYGAFLGEIEDYRFTDCTLHQAQGAGEHGLRLYGKRIIYSGGEINSSLAKKSCVWFPDGEDLYLDTSFIGGAIRIGAREKDDQGITDAKRVYIRGSHLKSGGGDNPVICCWPGSDGVHIGPYICMQQTGGAWLHIDSKRTKNIRWGEFGPVIVNGEKVDGWQGVDLGGMSQDEAEARGIGPAK